MIFSIIERFTALMYKRTNNALTVDEALPEMFMKDGRDVETIRPTFAALLEKHFVVLVLLAMCEITH